MCEREVSLLMFHAEAKNPLDQRQWHNQACLGTLEDVRRWTPVLLKSLILCMSSKCAKMMQCACRVTNLHGVRHEYTHMVFFKLHGARQEQTYMFVSLMFSTRLSPIRNVQLSCVVACYLMSMHKPSSLVQYSTTKSLQVCI